MLEDTLFREEETFIRRFIAVNRGRPLFLIRFERISLPLDDFASLLYEEIHSLVNATDIDFGFLVLEELNTVLLCLSPRNDRTEIPNIDGAVGRFQDECAKSGLCAFEFGVGRTPCNYLSASVEIYRELYGTSLKNLNDNVTRWKWTFFNRANMYLSGSKREAMIQPAVAFDPATNTFSVKGGELFIGGGHYAHYRDLIADLPDDQDLNRFELLILEKLILASEGLPGKLKFNISPQSFIDTFHDELKVKRLHGLIQSIGLEPERMLFELVEKPYEERRASLKEVCKLFWQYGIGFAADDFGVKSQSHQVILDLGIMIREFKLDPMSFRFKANEDQTKFLDNLAFIAYCKRLADNREATITAEAVEDLDTLQFLMEHRIYQFQSNLFCGKISVEEYRSSFALMQNLPYDTFERLVTEPGHRNDFDHNVFLRARKPENDFD